MASPFFPDHPYLPQNDAFQSQNALLAAQMVLAHGAGGSAGAADSLAAVPLGVPPAEHCGGAMVAADATLQAACASASAHKGPDAAEERPGTSQQHDSCGKRDGAGAKRRRRADRSNGVKAPVDAPLLHCEHCNYSTKGEYRLQQHVERKHESNAVILVHCGKCQYECNSLLDMKTHKVLCDEQAKAADVPKGDSGSLPVSPHKAPSAHVPHQRFYCTGCGFWTSEEATLSAHIEIAHAFDNEPVVFQCPRCSYSCGRRSAWEAHATLAHGNESGLIEPLVKYKKHSLDGDEDIRRYKAGEKAKRARRARRGRVTVIKADLLSPVQCDKLRRVAKRRAARATSAIGVSDGADGEPADERALFEEPSITRRGRWLYCDLCGTRSDDVQEILGHVHQEHGAQPAAADADAQATHGDEATADGGEKAGDADKHADGEATVQEADGQHPGDSTDAAEEEQSLFQCDYCNYHTMHESNIKVHVVTHFQKSSHNYKRLKRGTPNGVRAARARSKKVRLEENGNESADQDVEDEGEEEKAVARQRCDEAEAHSDTADNNAAHLHGVDVKLEAV